jgi:hypothetical protein
MMTPIPAAVVEPRGPGSLLSGAVLGVLAMLLIGFGVYPAPLITLVRSSAVALVSSP